MNRQQPNPVRAGVAVEFVNVPSGEVRTTFSSATIDTHGESGRRGLPCHRRQNFPNSTQFSCAIEILTMDRYGHLMEELDARTADRLGELADFWSGPTRRRGTRDKAGKPLTRGTDW